MVTWFAMLASRSPPQGCISRPKLTSVTKPGELVLDPCCGQATTGEAALLEGRRFLGVDSDAGALALATKRLQGL
jgi:adenine-specific DNA-methyltransferase